ncbi:MAG: hypothetical protein RJA98_1220 [Pseudomonadota bacterium]|jgi:hypothetical protein
MRTARTVTTSTTALLALVAAASLSACAGMNSGMSSMAPFSQADLPAAVQVPAGHKVMLETAAAGDITYECRAKKDMPAAFEWVFVGPDAGLNSRAGQRLGRYFGPPATWAHMDGSSVTGTQLAVAPGAAGSIPLQLVKANPAMGMGALSGVSHIQRVNTQGGVAPAAMCASANMGQKQVVSYRADYIFWMPV